MSELQSIQRIGDIEFRIIYSNRRTLGISVLPDASVVVRVPYRSSGKTIFRMVEEKSSWIIRHRDNYRNQVHNKPGRSYINGTTHLFRGNECTLNISRSVKSYVRFNPASIELGLEMTEDEMAIRSLLYHGYKNEAVSILPVILNRILEKYADQMFKPTELVVRSMKRRWGSCSNKGKITLSTELVKLADKYIEYVIVHELCHLKHHNHGPKYYDFLSGIYPDWKRVRRELRSYINN